MFSSHFWFTSNLPYIDIAYAQPQKKLELSIKTQIPNASNIDLYDTGMTLEIVFRNESGAVKLKLV